MNQFALVDYLFCQCFDVGLVAERLHPNSAQCNTMRCVKQCFSSQITKTKIIPDTHYNAVIGRRRPYRVIMRTALYWSEQQKMLVSLSCHIIISLNDCWSCTACCRCYQLGYQISVAAPYTAPNHGLVQRNVQAACVFTMFVRLLIYLLPPYASCLARLLWFITYFLSIDASIGDTFRIQYRNEYRRYFFTYFLAIFDTNTLSSGH